MMGTSDRKRVILVCGPANSGRTESIRRFLGSLGMHFPNRPSDVTVVVQIQKDGILRNLGITSAGEEPEAIKRNLQFLNRYPWDVIVCAAKSQGNTADYVREFADSGRAELIPVPTSRAGAREIEAEQRRVAQKIENYIWQREPAA